MATEYHILEERRPEVKRALRVALVHHHPFQFNTAAEGMTSAILKKELAQVAAIGCGTSLGAEGMAKSYNLVNWDPESRRWSSAFFLDQNGGGFKELRATSSILEQ